MGGRIKVDEPRFRKLWNAGTPVTRMAAELGITTDSLNRVRVSLGLPARTPRTRAKPTEPYRDPTPQEIIERSAIVRAGWTPEMEERRRVQKSPKSYEFPTVRIDGIEDAMEWPS